MSILLPCRRLVQTSTIGRRAVIRLNSQIEGFSILPRRSNNVLPSQRRQLTLPDLSKLSSLGSALSNGADGSNGDKYEETIMLPYAKDDLFDIVSNVDEYSSFVPYCVGSKVQPSSEKQLNNETKEFLADLAIGYGQFQESYTSKVTIIDGKSVQVSTRSSPSDPYLARSRCPTFQATAIPTPLFKQLETKWIFTQHSPQSTQVDFTINYSFSNPLYAAFAKTAMEKMTGKMVEAFKERAEKQKHIQT
jgi:coenzyme Q-binding protein COQ10